jgi:hypothetical protein
MLALERPGDLAAVADPVVRRWMDARWNDALAEGAEVRFLLLAPDDAPTPVLWCACFGGEPAGLAELVDAFE